MIPAISRAWIIGLLLLGSGLSAVSGVLAWRYSRHAPYLLLRRREVRLGGKLVCLSLGLLVAAGLVCGWGQR